MRAQPQAHLNAGTGNSKTAEDYKIFLDTRADYIARERAASEKSDQVLIAGAAGALAISVTFIEKIASTPALSTSHLLMISWSLLLAALAGAIFKYDLRATAYRIAYAELQENYLKGTSSSGKVENLNRQMENTKNFSISCLFVGIAFLVLFAYQNIPFGLSKESKIVTSSTNPSSQATPSPHNQPTPVPDTRELVPPPPPPPAPPPKK